MALKVLSKAHRTIVEVGNHWQAYATVLGIPGFVIFWFIKVTSPFSETGWDWSEATVLTFLALLALGLVGSLVVIGYRLIKPLPPQPVAPKGVDIATVHPPHQELLDEAAKLRFSASELQSAFENLRGDQVTTNSKAVEALEIAKAWRVEGVSQNGKLEAYKDELIALRNSTDRLNERIRAIANRETLALLRTEIDKDDALLFFPDAVGFEDADWIDWRKREKVWRSSVQHWSTVASMYVEGDVWARIKSVPTDDYLGTWSFDDKIQPDANTIHQYKTFCIMRRRLADVEAETNNAVYMAAFG